LHETERFHEHSLFFPRRQALAYLADATLAAGEPQLGLQLAGAAVAAPAEDVRSRVIGLRVLGACLDAAGDRPAAQAALGQAVALAGATQMTAELAATTAAQEALA
jgi:hypothetical protein